MKERSSQRLSGGKPTEKVDSKRKSSLSEKGAKKSAKPKMEIEDMEEPDVQITEEDMNDPGTLFVVM